MNEQQDKEKLLELARAMNTLEQAATKVEDIAFYFGDSELVDDCHRIHEALRSINDRIRSAIKVAL